MKNTDDYKENLTLREVAEFFRISYKQAAEEYMTWEKFGIIPFRVGRQVLFSREQVYGARKSAALV
jgi:hypothetical protein